MREGGKEVRTIIGIDNGVSGGIAILAPDLPPRVFSTPVKEVFGYQKVAKKFKRLDHAAFEMLMARETRDNEELVILIERPMVMPARFDATVSALRCYEATLVVLETFLEPHRGASVETIDSRQWQKIMLPTGIKGPELKKASRQRGLELFPSCADWINTQKDADPLLIAEWGRRHR